MAAGAALVVAALGVVGAGAAPVSADTTTAVPTGCPPPSANAQDGVLQASGASTSSPIVTKLMTDDEQGLGTLQGHYFIDDPETTLCDFAEASVDFSVAEFPLHSTALPPVPGSQDASSTPVSESAAAAANGRPTYAYVPLAAVPVAIGAVALCDQSTTYSSTSVCHNLQVSMVQLTDMLTGSITEWNDPALDKIQGGKNGITPFNDQVFPRFIAEPSADTYALSQAIIGQSASKAVWDQYLSGSRLTDTGPVEEWPSGNGAVHNGDQGLIDALLFIRPGTNPPVPPNNPQLWGQSGNIAAIPVDWLTPPFTVIEKMAIQNAAGSYVLPSSASAAAALADATVDTSTNLVTFQPSTTDTAAYPIMTMSYLLVPLSGLSSAKATALSNLINFAYSTDGQKDITALGAAPPTAAMMSTGKAVAAEVASESSSSGAGSSGSSGSSGSTTATTAAGATAAGSGSSDGSSGGSSPATASGGSGPSLAFTGFTPLPLFTGIVLVVAAVVARRVLRRRSASEVTP
jgi:ABC-type phosphate transport system substrate-binding protein